MVGNEFVLNGLSACQVYWVTVTAVNCGSRVRSEAALVDVFSPAEFMATIVISGVPCGQWTNTDVGSKQREVQDFILQTLASCGYSISCMGNSTFSCQASTIVNYRYYKT